MRVGGARLRFIAAPMQERMKKGVSDSFHRVVDLPATHLQLGRGARRVTTPHYSAQPHFCSHPHAVYTGH